MARAEPFVHPIDVRYLEVDRQGVVFNMWYLAYLDDAMTAFLSEGGLPYGDMLARGLRRPGRPHRAGLARAPGLRRPGRGPGRGDRHRSDLVHPGVHRLVLGACGGRGPHRVRGGPHRRVGEMRAPPRPPRGPRARGLTARPAPGAAAGERRSRPDDGIGIDVVEKGTGAGAEPPGEPAPVVGGQAVEEGPRHQLGGVSELTATDSTASRQRASTGVKRSISAASPAT